MKLHLIRHGMTEGNLRRLYYGSADLPLLPEGEEELRQRREKGGYPAAPRYYTSGMLRTEQTLRCLYGEVPFTPLPGMRETNFGIFEMKTYEEIKDWPEYQHWIEDIAKNPIPGGESAPEVYARAVAALKPLLEAGEDAVVITHGGVISGLMDLWFPGPEKNFYRWAPKPGTGYTVTFAGQTPLSWEQLPKE